MSAAVPNKSLRGIQPHSSLPPHRPCAAHLPRSSMRSTFRLLALSATFAVGSTAAAQPESNEGLNIALPAAHPRAQNVGIGLEEASAGANWIQGIRVDVPLGRFAALGVRAWGLLHSDDPRTTDFGGRLDFIGRGPVFLNLVRLYGGGGPQIFTEVRGPGGGKTQIGGGGQFGFEFFMAASISLYLEVGGQSGGVDNFGGGAFTAAGIHIYL